MKNLLYIKITPMEWRGTVATSDKIHHNWNLH